MRLVLIFISIFTSVATTLGAQVSAGRIVGVVVDSKTGAPLSDVTVQVTATGARSRTGVDGRFSLVTQPGTVAIQLRRIGFAPKTVSGIVIPWGGAVEQNVTLDVAAARLAAQVVTASAERGTVSEALNKQRATTAIVNSITAEQIARSPDGDAAQAVGRVSGVTVQDNKYVFVRGLGERYTTTSLNGVRIPSPEPERRAVPLDIFPSSLLQSVTTSKTFTPDQPGDFSGAQVNLETREFPLRRVVTYATSVGFNAAATGKPLPLAPA
ncbi:MAG: TonB-dependent receptor plug domain-containing protein, partial [Gemmatimonadaceae bacterium]